MAWKQMPDAHLSKTLLGECLPHVVGGSFASMGNHLIYMGYPRCSYFWGAIQRCIRHSCCLDMINFSSSIPWTSGSFNQGSDVILTNSTWELSQNTANPSLLHLTFSPAGRTGRGIPLHSQILLLSFCVSFGFAFWLYLKNWSIFDIQHFVNLRYTTLRFGTFVSCKMIAIVVIMSTSIMPYIVISF